MLLIFFCSLLLPGSVQSAQLRTGNIKVICLVGIHSSGHWPPAAATGFWTPSHQCSQMGGCCVSIPMPRRQHPLLWVLEVSTAAPTQPACRTWADVPTRCCAMSCTSFCWATTGVSMLSAVEVCFDLSPCRSLFAVSGCLSDVCCNIWTSHSITTCQTVVLPGGSPYLGQWLHFLMNV